MILFGYLQSDFPLRMRAAVRRRRPRRNRRIAGRRSAARGSAGAGTPGARRRSRYHLLAGADDAARTQPHDRAIGQRLPLLCLGRGRDRRAHRSRSGSTGATSATCAPLPTLPIGVGFGISTAEQAREVATFADAVVVGSAISLLIEAHAQSDRTGRNRRRIRRHDEERDARGAQRRRERDRLVVNRYSHRAWRRIECKAGRGSQCHRRYLDQMSRMQGDHVSQRGRA